MFATCAIGGVHYGTGRHMTDLSDEDILKAMRVSISFYWICNDN
jgi:pseudouridine-5'-phosphate glycosidase